MSGAPGILLTIAVYDSTTVTVHNDGIDPGRPVRVSIGAHAASLDIGCTTPETADRIAEAFAHTAALMRRRNLKSVTHP